MKNKNIEIVTKKDSYTQEVLNISELDIAMLELETLKNQKNDIQKEKFSFMEQLKIFYQNIVQKIKLIKQRTANHRRAIKSYQNLMKDTKDMFKNGLKNKDDSRIIGNTKMAGIKEIMIDKLNIKILTLQLYKRM